MAASVLLKNTISTEEWMAASWNKETLYPEKNCFLQLNAVTWKENFFFRNRYFGSHSFFMGCYLTKIFVHLPVIPLVCYFSVYKLIAWDPANIYLFKVNSGNTTKRYGISPKFTISTTESCCGVFTVKCFYWWLWADKCLLTSSLLCEFYYPKSKDE